MEVVLQWLDELDDLVFAGFSLWRRIRHCCLVVALAAAVSLHVLPGFGASPGSVMPLLDTSLVALAIWIVLVAVTIQAENSWRTVAGRV